jgi:SagB-type dehydrogenase family enzyme
MRAYLLCIVSLSLAVSTVASGREDDQRIALPRAETAGKMSVEQALKKRRSVRDFGRGGLSLDDVAQLLWAAQGTTHREGYRTAPSAGAMYPLELYLVVGDVSPLSPGVYRYLPKRHDLVRVTSGDRRSALAAAALDQDWVRRPPAVIVISGIYERSSVKYGRRAQRYTHIEVGHVAQNVYLQATALGLGTVLVGAFRDDEVQEALELPVDHEPLGLMPVGRKP